MKNEKIRIITTVGTSLISNFLEKNKSLASKVKELKEDISTKKNIHFSKEKWEEHTKQWVNPTSLKNNIISYGEKYKKKSCAELQSINQIAQGYKKVEVILLSSYTLDGYLAATIIKKLLESEKILDSNYKVILDETPVEGLVVDSAKDFQSKVINFLSSLIDRESKRQDAELVLNVTGGYKALIPYVTIIAQLKKIDLKYIYEESDELITVGNLPINFDWELAENLIGVIQDNKLINQLGEDDELFVILNEYNLIEIKKNQQNEEKQTIIPSKFSAILIELVNNSTVLERGYLGWVLEHLLYIYFNEENKDNYHKSRISNLPQKKFNYEIINDFPNYKFDNCIGQFDLGDIDLIVENKTNNSKMLCEIKTIGSISNFNEEYFYRQVCPRLFAYWKFNEIKADTETIEFSIFLYQVIFDKRQQQFEKEKAVKDFIKLYEGLFSKTFKNVIFRTRGFYINVKQKDLKLNFTNLLRERLNDISWIDIHNGNIKTKQNDV